jgi:hypothetical protein
MPLEQIIPEYASCEQLDSVHIKSLLQGDLFSKYVYISAKFAAFMRLAEG